MPIYNLMLRQKFKGDDIKNLCFGFGSKSLANYNILSNNLKTFIKVLEGNLFYVVYLINVLINYYL